MKRKKSRHVIWMWIDGPHFVSSSSLCECVCVFAHFDYKWVKMIDDDKIIVIEKKHIELWVVHKITLIFFTVTLGISQWITHTHTHTEAHTWTRGSRKTSLFGMRVLCQWAIFNQIEQRSSNRFHLIPEEAHRVRHSSSQNIHLLLYTCYIVSRCVFIICCCAVFTLCVYAPIAI